MLVLNMKAEEPCQCCFAGLLAMETGSEDRFERDERLRVQNPAGSKVVSLVQLLLQGGKHHHSTKSSFLKSNPTR